MNFLRGGCWETCLEIRRSWNLGRKGGEEGRETSFPLKERLPLVLARVIPSYSSLEFFFQGFKPGSFGKVS